MKTMIKQLPNESWGGLSRRRFLKGAIVAVGGIGVGTSLTACSTPAGRAGDGQPLLLLSVNEATTLTTLGEAIIPRQKGFPSLAEAEVVARIDEELSFVGKSIQSDMRAALSVLEFAPFLYGHFSRYSRLDEATRRTLLGQMMTSRSEILRAVATNMKVLIHFMYFGHRSSWKAIGYDGPFAQRPPIASAQRKYYAAQTGRTAS